MDVPPAPERPKRAWWGVSASERLKPLTADRPGQLAHALLGCLLAFLLAWPTTWVELAGVPVIVFWIVRLRRTLPTFIDVVRQPVVAALLALAAWNALSLSWSPDPKDGVWQLAGLRWAWMFLILWPSLDRRRWFVLALALGFLAGNLSQVSHALGRSLGIEAMTWNRLPDRNSGWWDPVVGGSLLCAALGLHIPAVLAGRGRSRLAGIAGVLITLVAIAATGTRGAMIAAVGLLGVSAVWWALDALTQRQASGRRIALRRLSIMLTLLGVGVAGAWIFAGQTIARRADLARNEIVQAIEHKQYHTDTGARIAMAIWSVDALAAHPLHGVGYGGFRHWMQQRAAADGLPPGSMPIHAHAHNALLHQAATTGLIGLGLALLVFVLAMRNAVLVAKDAIIASRACIGTPSEAYLAGPAFALAGLLLVSAFDPIQINAQTAALACFLMAVTLPRATEVQRSSS